MVTKSRISLLSLLLLLFTGCEKNLDSDKVPQFVSKLVITSFLTPGNNINEVVVSANQPLFGDLETENKPGKLTGFISDGTKEIKLDTLDGKLYFSSRDMKIIEGKKYSLRIISDKGMEAKSECMVPWSFNSKAEIDTFSVYKNFNGRIYPVFNTVFSFKDSAGYENYYMVRARQISYKKYSSEGQTYIYDVILGNNIQLYNDGSAGEDGRIKIPLKIGIHPGSYDSSYLKVYLLNTGKPYYLYHKSLENYNDGENPFAEPTPVYSNIEGGLGVFSAYLVDSVVFRLF